MRGINASSVVLLLIFIWNISVLIFRRLRKKSDIFSKVKSNTVRTVTIAMNILLITGLVYYSIAIDVTHYIIKSDKIPQEFNGYKILQISDFHTGSFYGGVEALIEEVRNESPDIIVLTGDMIDDNKVNLVPVMDLAVQLLKIAPVYSVSGNHDVWYVGFKDLQKSLENTGVIFMNNRKVILQRGTSSINLYGIGDPESWNYKIASQYVHEKIQKLKPDGGYNILLFHRANMFDVIKGKGFHLVLSGHMHGGQMQIPFLGGLVSPHHDHRWFPKYTDGKWNEEDTTLIVNRGLGNNAPVPRLLNPPEVVVITLQSEN